MKRIFPIIIVLIGLSLIGIIFIQISWLHSMVELRKEQTEQSIYDVTQEVAQDLAQYKGASSAGSMRAFPDLQNDFGWETPRSYNVGQRFTTQELQEKISKAFSERRLAKVPFQFALVVFKDEIYSVIERQSASFGVWYQDSTQHFWRSHPIVPPSGSNAENFSSDEYLIVIVPQLSDIVYKGLRPRIIIAILFTFVIFTAFYLTVRTMLRQKKMSEIRNDFINNMTHEFKTPIATISLAVDALKNEKVQKNVEKLSYFSGIIKEENQRMNRQVETILKSALMDRQEVQLNLKPLHVHQIITDVADNFMLRLQEKQGGLQLKLEAINDEIDGDEVHISNLINNLMDNAVKYAKDEVPPQILLTTTSNAKKLIIRMEDNGIGMTRETVKHIFEKFYRAHTGNLHNVKGFGLGLNYVKSVVVAHHGTVKVESTLGKGSCFFIELPLRKTSS